MAIFMIERTFAEKIQEDPEAAAQLNLINDEEGVRWIISFLSADRKRTFCLYEAPNAEAIIAAARRAGAPVDAVIEVREEMLPTGKINRIRADKY